MSHITVRCEVREYPDKTGEYQTLSVANHWNDKEKVVLTIAGVSYTFIAEHLKQAISNAQNAH